MKLSNLRISNVVITQNETAWMKSCVPTSRRNVNINVYKVELYSSIANNDNVRSNDETINRFYASSFKKIFCNHGNT